ncbi:MAG: 2-succinyl-5-enolpyruvyl-6-hydroxy-3-cyclohexene-1-carboxylic-acid synthase, partial [Chlamydiales bacterium]|nr:2-succinyl-5-enolpyruvyl-6-hydroxy-3-cyclohexene-1-carboxylic-acid synthase [Chlamydiales bacterium]
MTASQGSINLQWAHRIIDTLFQLGVNPFFMSPGSRSTPLVIALAEHPEAQHLIHFDERGTAFSALGCAKAQNSASAMIVTSGTAVGNLLPAVMEACNSRIPLILLTADRPKELYDCGANQTCDHIKLFSSYVRWQIDLPSPSCHISDRYLLTTLSQAVFKALQNNPGPVHINCPFPEPLFSSEVPNTFPALPTPFYEQVQSFPQESSLKRWAHHFEKASKGVILLGSLPSHQKIQPIFDLASRLQWPILADPLSQARSLGKKKESIRYYDAILKTCSQELNPDLILHLGDRLTSKALAKWLQRLNTPSYFQVTDHPNRQDHDHLVTSRLCVDPTLFCEQISPFLKSDRKDTSWIESWEALSQNHTPPAQEGLTEPAIVRLLSQNLNPSWSLFISNSMPIRNVDQFLFPDQPIGPIFCNRGVSGIDGNIATACGIAIGRKQPVLAFLGDIAFLHDLNSLDLLNKTPYPIVLLISN